MKLRIRGNSLRLRLNQSEVASLSEDGQVEDAIQFGIGSDQQLSYRIETRPNVSQVSVVYHSANITVFAPESLIGQWITTEQTGFEAAVPIGNGELLTVLIERDFTCLIPRAGEDETDAFPNPLSEPAR